MEHTTDTNDTAPAEQAAPGIGDTVQLADGYVDGNATYSNGFRLDDDMQVLPGLTVRVTGRMDSTGDVALHDDEAGRTYYAKADRLVPFTDELPSAWKLATDVARLEAELARKQDEVNQARDEADHAKTDRNVARQAAHNALVALQGLGNAEGLERALAKHAGADDVEVHDDTDDDGPMVTVTMRGVRLDSSGTIVPASRMFRVDVEVLMVVECEVFVEATDEDDAHDKARELVDQADFIADTDDLEVEVDGYHVSSVEPGNIREA